MITPSSINGHAVADLAGEADLVGDDDHRHPLRGEFAHHVQHLLDQLGVERARDLVEQHHVRVHRQGASDGHALLLAAGQPFRVLVHLVRHAHAAEQRLGLGLAPLRAFGSRTFSWAIETFSSALLCGNRLNCWNTIPTRRRTKSRSSPVRPSTRDLLPLQQDAALVGRLEQVDAAKQRGLAGAAGTEHAHDRAPIHLEVTPRRTCSAPKRLWTLSSCSIAPPSAIDVISFGLAPARPRGHASG